MPNGKLLAQPFGGYAADPQNHGTLRSLIFGAVIEITKAREITVYAPQQSRSSKRMLRTFLIYNLTEKQRQTLLQRGIWSSTKITFRVLPLEPACPDYLFTIKGLTLTTKEVHNAVDEVWHDSATIAFLDATCSQVPEENRHQTAQAIMEFINSMRITKLDTKDRGNTPAPSFRVYTSGDTISDDSTWCRLQNYFMSREYKIKFQDPGTNTIPRQPCSLCHGCHRRSDTDSRTGLL